MTRACFFFFRASRKSSEPRWLTPEGLSSQDCSGGGGACGLQKQQRIILIYDRETRMTQVNTTRESVFHSLEVNKCSFCLNLAINGAELPFRNLQKPGSVGNRHQSAILNRIAHLCMNSMILSLFRSCGSVYFSSPFTKYFRLGKPEILKRSPTALCTVASTAANTPGPWRNIKQQTLNKSKQLIILSN